MTSVDRAARGIAPSRSSRLRSAWYIFLIPILLLLVLFFIVPMLDLFSVGFSEPGTGRRDLTGFTLGNFMAILGDRYYLEMLANSLQLGLFTTIATLVIGYPVAFYLTKAQGWERTLIAVACLLPIFVNIIVAILGWYILLLPFGVLQQLFTALGLMEGPLPWLRSFWALIAVLTYEHLPFAILILATSLQHVPQDKIAAARILGASSPRILWTVVLPLTMPGLVASAVLVFSLSISSYLVPILLSGPRTQVIPISIFRFATELFNWPMASALALVLLIVVGTATYGFIVLTNRITHRGEWEMV